MMLKCRGGLKFSDSSTTKSWCSDMIVSNVLCDMVCFVADLSLAYDGLFMLIRVTGIITADWYLAPSPVTPLMNKNNYIIKKLCNGLMVMPGNE